MNPNIRKARKYTLFVDESGDSGLTRVNGIEAHGATTYMTMGGVLIPDSHFLHVNKGILKIENTIGRAMHCNELNHMQKRLCALEMSKHQILCFGVISDKRTLQGYREDISRDNALYYNKCAQYLLECLGHFMTRYDIPRDDVNIVFERANYNYSALRNLIRKCQETPFRGQSKTLKKINIDQIFNEPKNEEPLLKFADVVAHALYKTVQRGPRDYGLSEFSYIEHLAGKFYSHDRSGKVVNYGIKPIHNLSELNLDEYALDKFKAMVTVPRPRPE